jgi:dipeptidyl-peptidase-4
MPSLRALPGIALLALSLSSPLPAQTPDSSLLTVERVFGSAEFAPEPLGDVRWVAGAAAYTRIESDSAIRGAAALVRYDAATGTREVWVPAARLVPAGDSVPLDIEDYALSPDRMRLLLFTNSRKVWRQNTRGDFWVLDLGDWRLHKLGGPEAEPSTLMFAKFSPDGARPSTNRSAWSTRRTRPRRRAPFVGGPGWTPPGSPCGAGAAAARPR